MGGKVCSQTKDKGVTHARSKRTTYELKKENNTIKKTKRELQHQENGENKNHIPPTTKP